MSVASTARSSRCSRSRDRRRLASLLCAALLVVPLGCLDPKDRRPGLWLSGDVAADAVDDWSFTDQYREILIETKTWYLIPHSVTIACTSLEGRLYVGARHPTEKRWVANVGRDPDVRLEIGDVIYERRLERVEDPDEEEAVYRAYAAKYGWEVVSPRERPELWYFRVVSRN